MTTITFQVDLDRLTIDDLIAVEEGEGTRRIRDVLARFAVNGSGDYLPEEEAQAAVGSLSIKEFTALQTDLVKQMQEAQNGIVPPE
jgi:hypothetical protein